MSKDLNHCTFIGRLGKDPEVKFMDNGTNIVNFSIACGDDYKDKSGQKVERTNWINVVAFGKLAEIIGQYVKKGSQIHISGKQVTRKWTDKDGNDRYTTEIVASDMQMLGGKTDSAPSQNSAPPAAKPADKFDDFDSDIPF